MIKSFNRFLRMCVANFSSYNFRPPATVEALRVNVRAESFTNAMTGRSGADGDVPRAWYALRQKSVAAA